MLVLMHLVVTGVFLVPHIFERVFCSSFLAWYVHSGTEFMGGHAPQHLDRGEKISFVPSNIL